MNKKILLIGNDGGLPGVKVDLENYKNYFKSNRGGKWYDSEFLKKINPRKDSLIASLDELKTEDLDYLIVIFSGHGGQKRETVLELNQASECLSETRFHGIAKRQLTILDCCRAYSEAVEESLSDMLLRSARDGDNIRQRFEQRILSASEQQVKLYACSVGEFAYDTPEGGAYSKNLIKAAVQDNSDFIYVGQTHVSAAEETTREFDGQHPEAIQPRLLSTQQLIFGIK